MASIESIYAEYIIDIKKAEANIESLTNKVINSNRKIEDSEKKVVDSVDKVSDSFKKSEKTVEKFADNSTNKLNTLLTSLSSLAAAAGLSSLYNKIEQTGMALTTQLSKVGAITRASEEEMSKLRKEAERLGATTQASASEAASAMLELAKAGLDTQQIMKATGDVLNLAAAGDLSLAEAASIAADTMSQFNLKAEQVSFISDVLAATANSSTISVRDVAESFKYAGSIANSVSVPLEQVGAMVSIMGSAGIKASMAGTALRGALLRLSSPPAEARKALEALNIEVKTTEGNLKPMPVLFSELNKKFKDLSEARQIEILSKIFGAEAASGVLAVIKAGGERIEELSTKLKEQGFAAQVASKNLDNLEGDYVILSSAVDGVYQQLFKALEPAIRAIVQGITYLINVITELVTSFPNFSKALIVTTAVALAFVAIIAGTSGIIGALKALNAGLLLSQARILLFGNTLATEAGKATFRWASLLGPFALGATALVFTLTFLISYIKERDDREKENKNVAFTEQVKPIIRTEKLETGFRDLSKDKSLSTSFDYFNKSLKENIENVKEANQAINNLVAALSLLRDNKASEDINKIFNALSEKDKVLFATAAVKRFKEVLETIKNNETDKKAKEIEKSFSSLGGSTVKAGRSIKEIFEEIDKAIKEGNLQNARFNIVLNSREIERKSKEIYEIIRRLKEIAGEGIDLTIKERTKEVKDKKSRKTLVESQEIVFNIKDTKDTRKNLEEIESLITKIKDTAEKSDIKIGKSDFWDQWTRATGDLNEFESALKRLDNSYDKFMNTLDSGNLAEKIGAGSKFASEMINQLGTRYMKLYEAQSKMSSVLRANQFQNINALFTYSIAILDKEIKEFEKAEREKIKLVDERIKAIEEAEKESLDRLKKLRQEANAQIKAEVDALYQQEAETIRLRYEEKIAQIDLEVSDENERNTLKAIAFEDYQNTLAEKRAEYDELERSRIEERNAQISEEEERVRQQSIASKEEEAKKKEEIEKNITKTKEEAEKKKAELTQKQAIIQYTFDLANFFADKNLKISQAKMNFAMTMLNAVAGLASAFAAGPVAFALALPIMALLTGMAAATTAMTIATIQATQPPPPPPSVFGFSQGGLVEGSGNNDSVPAMLTPGELIVPRKNFDQVVESYNNEKVINVSINMSNTFTNRDNDDSIIRKISEQVIKTIKYSSQELVY